LETAALTADDVVLVTAAAGGIGGLVLQEARNVGALPVGMAGGAAKVEQARQLGAAVAVDYGEPGWPDEVRAALDGREVTIALDGVGGALGRGALELLGVGGRLLMLGWASGEPIPLSAMDIFGRGLTVGAAVGPKLLRRPGGRRELESRALDAAATGRLVPLVGQAFPLAVSLLLLVGDFAPALVSPLTGAVADRFDRKRVMIGCELAQGALLVLIALILPPLPVLLALVALRATLGQTFLAASRAAIPSLVTENDLAAGNSVLGFGSNGAEAVGPFLAAA